MTDSTVSNNGWVVDIDFDTKKIEKGVDKIDKIIAKLDRSSGKATVQQNINNKATQSAKNQTNESKKQTVEARKKLALERARLGLRKTANSAEKFGLDPEAKSGRSALGANNPVTLQAKKLEIEKAITNERQKQWRLQQQAKNAGVTNRPAAIPRGMRAADPNRLQDMRLKIDDMAVRVNGAKVSAKEMEMLKARVRELRAEIGKVKTVDGLGKVNTEFKAINRSMARATAQQREFNKQTNAGKFAAEGFTGSLKNMARSFIGIYAVVGAIKSIHTTMKQLDNIKATMLVGAGSARQAADDFEYLSSVSNHLGIDLLSSAKAYARLTVSTKAANMTLQESRDIYLGLMEASTAFGLSADDSAGVVRAIEQMVSKGTVMALGFLGHVKSL